MAKSSLGKLDTRQPVAVDLAKVHDISARLNTPAALPQMNADFIAPINVPQPKAWRPSALAVLDGVLGGATFTESRRNEEDRHRAELAMPQMEALKTRLLAELGKAGPDELKAYLTNPGEFGKNIATRLAASDLAAGSSRVYGNPDQGGSVYTAPKTDTAAGQAFSYGPDGVKPLGAVPFVPDYQTLAEGGKAIPKMPVLPPGFGGPAAMAAGLPQIGEARPVANRVASAPLPAAVQQQIRSTAIAAGAPPEALTYLERLAQIESAGNPAARNGSSTGVFQFQPSTFATVGGGDINSVEDQTRAALRLAAQDRRKLVELGIEPTDANLYIMHQQGAGGGPALLTAPPEINAVAALAPAYGGDAAKARRAIVGNGGTADMTAGEFTGMWRRKWGGSPSSASATAAPTPSDPEGTIYGAPKAKPPLARPATDAEKAVYGIPANVPAQMKADGTVDVIALPKGTADIERDAQAKQAQILKAKDIISTVDAAMAKIGKGEAGFVGAKMAEVPGTKAYDVARQIETIKANLGFQELAAMRAASPTGGALGAIAVQELVALQSTVANLDIGQSESQLRGNLGKIKGHYQRWLDATQSAGAPPPGRESGWSKALPAPQVDAAKRFKGTKAVPGDPTNPFVPRNAAEFKNIPPGKSYIDDDGSVQVKR